MRKDQKLYKKEEKGREKGAASAIVRRFKPPKVARGNSNRISRKQNQNIQKKKEERGDSVN